MASTAQEAYVDGGRGLQTKVEIPYLSSLRTLGSQPRIVQAYLISGVVPGSSMRYLALPSALLPYLSGRGNQQGLAIGTAVGSLQTGISTHTELETSSYGLSIADYY